MRSQIAISKPPIPDEKLETPNQNGNGMNLNVLFSCLMGNCFQAECMDEALLKTEVLRLPVRERVLLAEALLDDDETRKMESAWAREAESRMVAYRRDEIPTEDGAEVIRELRERYGK